ncbi:hypothetical protein LCGC14_3133200 [marine sediment metagenome]|uniref:Uncharacterized protein n=1 Tax=marine sediment metagenome TaxID=412755 RepID=A0A0F8Y624_9ZZZZ
MWAKLKALPWIATAGMVLTAIVMGMACGKIKRLEKRAAKKTEKSIDLKNSKISSQIHKGKMLADSANTDLDVAGRVKERQEKRMESLGDRDETIDDIAHRFNSKRVRK